MTYFFDVLGLSADADEKQIRAAFNKLIVHAHPDTGGSGERVKELVAARDAALAWHRRSHAVQEYKPFQLSPEQEMRLETDRQQEVYRTAKAHALFMRTSPLRKLQQLLIGLTAAAAILAATFNQKIPIVDADTFAPGLDSNEETKFFSGIQDSKLVAQSVVRDREVNGHYQLFAFGSVERTLTHGVARLAGVTLDRNAPAASNRAPPVKAEGSDDARTQFANRLLADIDDTMDALLESGICEAEDAQKKPFRKACTDQETTDNVNAAFVSLVGDAHDEVDDFDSAQRASVRWLRNLLAGISFLLALSSVAVAAGIAYVTYRLRATKEEMAWLEDQLGSRRALSLIYAEFFSRDGSVRPEGELYRDFEWAMVSREREPIYMNSRDYDTLRQLVVGYYGVSDFIRMYLAKAVTLGIARRINDDVVRDDDYYEFMI